MQFDPQFRPSKIPLKGGVQYRLYFLDGVGHIEKAHEFEAKDDEAAIKIAEGWREGRKVELWRGKLRVKRWD